MRKFIIIFCLILLLIPFSAFAQANPCSKQGVTGQNASSTLPRCVNQIYTWSLGIAALLALLMIIVGGYYLMTSGGNAEQATKGKEYITSAIIGILILFTAYILLAQINPDLVNFNLKSLDNLNQPSAPRTTP